jgi:hypothetical protein
MENTMLGLGKLFSGGSDNVGPRTVIVEADSAEEAEEIARRTYWTPGTKAHAVLKESDG